MAQRDLRDLTRQRTTKVAERAAVVNRLAKVLEWANLKLGSVVTDVVGVSARAILAALVDGQRDEATLAELARGVCGASGLNSNASCAGGCATTIAF